MLPDYMTRDTMTIWNLVAKATPTGKDQLQRTTIKRVSCSIADQRTLDGQGNWRTAETLTAKIDLQSAEASDGRTYVSHEKWDELYAADPASVTAHWTLRPGFDYIGKGDIQADRPATGSEAKTIGGRRDYKLNYAITRGTPDGREFFKVTAT